MRDLSFIKMIEAVFDYGDYTTEEVILFNENQISGAEALFKAQHDIYSPSVLRIPKKQWIELFCNGVENLDGGDA